jgi:hypothetical protein
VQGRPGDIPDKSVDIKSASQHESKCGSVHNRTFVGHLSMKEREFVYAARFMGVPDWKIIFRHILPNMSSFLIIDATIN